MKRIACSLWLASFLPLTVFGAVPAKLDDPVEGQKLARELRSALPAEEITFNGTMRISVPRAEKRELPLQTRVVIEKDHWSSLYTTKSPGGETETLMVRHSPEKANEYEWRQGDKVMKLTGSAGTNRFAGSDFALLDLGLEFYHWPTQLLATREMRKGRGCDVLESRPARTNTYSRVLSWIDQESRAEGQPGLLMAYAYDVRGALLKEFEIKSFKNGQVTEMEIRNVQTKTSTRLQFDPDK